MATVGADDIHGLFDAAVPEPVRVVVDPMQTDRFPVIVGKAVPVPDSEIVGELLPVVVLLTVMVALLDPAVAGVKVTWKVTEAPGAIVNAERLPTTNSALLDCAVKPAASTPVFVIVKASPVEVTPRQVAGNVVVAPETARSGVAERGTSSPVVRRRALPGVYPAKETLANWAEVSVPAAEPKNTFPAVPEVPAVPCQLFMTSVEPAPHGSRLLLFAKARV